LAEDGNITPELLGEHPQLGPCRRPRRYRHGREAELRRQALTAAPEGRRFHKLSFSINFV
jgi:hypothetical protein